MADGPKKPTANDILFSKIDIQNPDVQGAIKSNTAPENKRPEVVRAVLPRGVVARAPAPGGAVAPRHDAVQIKPDQKPAIEQPGAKKTFRRFTDGEMTKDFNQAADRNPKHKI